MCDENVYLVKLRGMYRDEDLLKMKRCFEEQFDGKVVLVDSRVEDIVQLKPQDAHALVKLLVGDDWKDLQEES